MILNGIAGHYSHGQKKPNLKATMGAKTAFLFRVWYKIDMIQTLGPRKIDRNKEAFLLEKTVAALVQVNPQLNLCKLRTLHEYLISHLKWPCLTLEYTFQI